MDYWHPKTYRVSLIHRLAAAKSPPSSPCALNEPKWKGKQKSHTYQTGCRRASKWTASWHCRAPPLSRCRYLPLWHSWAHPPALGHRESSTPEAQTGSAESMFPNRPSECPTSSQTALKITPKYNHTKNHMHFSPVSLLMMRFPKTATTTSTILIPIFLPHCSPETTSASIHINSPSWRAPKLYLNPNSLLTHPASHHSLISATIRQHTCEPKLEATKRKQQRWWWWLTKGSKSLSSDACQSNSIAASGWGLKVMFNAAGGIDQPKYTCRWRICGVRERQKGERRPL